MKIQVQLNINSGLAYQNPLLGIDFHYNGKRSKDFELPLTDEQFKSLKRAMVSKRIQFIPNLDALQAEALREKGNPVPVEIEQAQKDDFLDKLNSLLGGTDEEQVEAIGADLEEKEEAPVEVKEEPKAEKPKTKKTKAKE